MDSKILTHVGIINLANSVEHNPEAGGHVQVAHGETQISLVVYSRFSKDQIAPVALSRVEAMEIGLDLIRQAQCLPIMNEEWLQSPPIIRGETEERISGVGSPDQFKNWNPKNWFKRRR